MTHPVHRRTLAALLFACSTSLLATSSGAQPVEGSAEPTPPPLDANCARWKAYHMALIAHHERTGTLSEAARDRATDQAYAGYAQCVMGNCTQSAVAARDAAIRLVLWSGTVVAQASDSPPAAGRR